MQHMGKIGYSLSGNEAATNVVDVVCWAFFRLTAVGTNVVASFFKSRSSGAPSIVAAAIWAAEVGFGGSDG